MAAGRRDLTQYDDEPYEDDVQEGEADPRQGLRASERSRTVALALCLTLGLFGAHRFYVGKTGSAFGMLFTFGGVGFWWLYDVILLASGEFRDAEDRVVRQWSTAPVAAIDRQKNRRLDQFEGDLDALRREVGELAERLDFAERLLAKNRDRHQLP